MSNEDFSDKMLLYYKKKKKCMYVCTTKSLKYSPLALEIEELGFPTAVIVLIILVVWEMF